VTGLPAAPTIDALHAGYAAGFDPLRAIDDVYRRIEATGDPGIFISLVPRDEALAMIRALGPFDPSRRPLWGVPFAIKDNIDLAGLPTTAACPDFAYDPTESAPAVARLVAAGAIPIGKTNMDQFATGLVGLRTPYPAPRNPFDPAIAPGGSSSGSAIAVARGLVSFALGTDTAGSGRVPAGLNNIVGLKPTRGAVSTRGVVPACRTLDCVSVFSLTVADAVAAYRAMAGFDPDDPFSRRLPPLRPSREPVHGIRVGVPDTGSRIFGGDRLAGQACDSTIATMATLGTAQTECDLASFFAAGRLLYDGPWVAERYAAIGKFIARSPQSVHPVVRQIVLAGADISAADAFAGLYRLAELRRATERIWDVVDVLMVPTIPRPRRVMEVIADPIGVNSELGTYCNFVNLLDLCALAIPGSLRGDDFPSGITLIAPAGCEDRLADLGAVLHPLAGIPPGFRLH
jgi:allophanate hydrolase